ncbi:hypothetical protein [Nocardiopsis alba]
MGKNVSPSRHCSPRTRGWTQAESGRLRDDLLLPAHAGMTPSR